MPKETIRNVFASQSRSLWLLAGIAVLYALVYSCLLILRFRTFSIGGLDLADYGQTIWKLAHGQSPWITLIGTHALADHFTVLWYPLALVIKPVLSPYSLLILHCACIAGVGVVIYRLVQRMLGDTGPALIFALAYLFSQYTQRVLFSPIHPESFSGLLIALALLFMMEEKVALYALFALLSITSNEDVGLYFIPVGVYLAYGKKRAVWGWITIMGSAVWLFMIFQFKSMLGPDTQNHLSRFALLGGSFAEIGRNLLLRPWIFIGALFNPDKLLADFQMFLQAGFLPLLSGWGMMLVAVPVLFKSLTNHVGMYRFWDHYSMAVLPFMWLAAAMGLGKAMKRKTNAPEAVPPSWPRKLLWGMLGVNILVQAALPYSPLSFKFDWKQLITNTHTRAGWNLIKRIPAEASVLTQERLVQAVAMRPEVYCIHYPGQVPGGVPKWQPEYVLFDTARFKGNWLETDLRAADAFFAASDQYQVMAAEDGWIVYKRISE
ncbi:MAG: DUF2079 domain-containing protein [candidate division FCPU426 bacterium]